MPGRISVEQLPPGLRKRLLSGRAPRRKKQPRVMCYAGKAVVAGHGEWAYCEAHGAAGWPASEWRCPYCPDPEVDKLGCPYCVDRGGDNVEAVG